MESGSRRIPQSATVQRPIRSPQADRARDRTCPGFRRQRV